MSFKGKKNIYLCQKCGRGHVSQDIDEGVTPFMSRCLHCDGMAQSMFYAAPQQALAKIPAAVVWYKPSEPEKAGLSVGTLAHVENGGLLLRIVVEPKP